MPAARSAKRRASPSQTPVDPSPNQGFQLTFASPSSLPSVLPTAPPTQGPFSLLQTSISFAPNVTPGTFTAPPPDDALLDGESARNALFPDTSGVEGGNPSGKRRRKTIPASASRATPMPSKAASKNSSKSIASNCPSPAPESNPTPPSTNAQAPTHIPRPPNAFILFRSSFIRSQHVSAETEGNHGTLSKIVGMLWHALSYEERQVWQTKARRAYAEHKKMYPGYSFRPTKEKFISHTPKSEREGTPGSSSDAPAPKRKTRTVGPRDIERCEHIAALLARGLKGAELDAAMKEFDAKRAPQAFTTRFEAPLTAQTYAESKSKEKKEVQIKEVKDEVKPESTDDNGRGQSETVMDAQEPQEKVESKDQTPPTLAQVQPRRVRRSSSAPLLDAGLSISAPAPMYPSSNNGHFLQSGPFEYGQQARNSSTSTNQHGRNLHQTFSTPFGFSQAYPQAGIIPEGIALRKRSASSSPPLRRPSYSFAYQHMQPQAFGQHFSNYPQQQQQEHPQFAQAFHAAHPHLQQTNAQVQAQVQSDHRGQPSGELGLGLDFDQRAQETNYGTNGNLSQQSTMSDVSSAVSTEADNGGFWNESVDFGNFSFSNAGGHEVQTPVSAHPSNPNPFDAPCMNTAPSSTSVEDYSYTDMPGLVEVPVPVYQNFYQTPSRPQHPHLEIQTSWSSQEFDFEQAPASAATVPPASALEPDSVPPSAVSGGFDYPPTSGVSSNNYLDYSSASQNSAQAPTPCSPTSQSVSGAPSSTGARTPVDESFSAWDQSSVAASATACASPVASYDACNASSPDEDTVAQAQYLALQAGFRAYLAHAEKTGALEKGAPTASFAQFMQFVNEQQGFRMSVDVGVGGLKGMNVPLALPLFQQQMMVANVDVM